MDPDHQNAVRELALLELVLLAHERRHEVVDAAWGSLDVDEAVQRLRSLLQAGDTDPQVILDLQISTMTQERRHRLASRVTELREFLRRLAPNDRGVVNPDLPPA